MVDNKNPIHTGRGKPRYHPYWLKTARSCQQSSMWTIGCAVIAAPASRTT